MQIIVNVCTELIISHCGIKEFGLYYHGHLDQPCSTSGQLAECGQTGHLVLPNVGPTLTT